MELNLRFRFVNRWALAPGLNSLAKSLNTKSEASDKVASEWHWALASSCDDDD